VHRFVTWRTESTTKRMPSASKFNYPRLCVMCAAVEWRNCHVVVGSCGLYVPIAGDLEVRADQSFDRRPVVSGQFEFRAVI
jgi:hypothetical protein